MIPALLRRLFLRRLREQPGRSVLTVLGVALGVAVYVSISLANHSALGAFAGTVDAVAGRASLEVAAPSGLLDESTTARVRKLLPGLPVAPVLQIAAAARAGAAPAVSGLPRGSSTPFSETVLLLGLDFAAEQAMGRLEPGELTGEELLAFAYDPRAIAVTEKLADRLNLKLGGVVSLLASGRVVDFNVRHIVRAAELQQAMGGSLAVAALPVLQQTFGLNRKISRVEITAPEKQMLSVSRRLQQQMGSGIVVRPPAARSRQVSTLVSAFALNLTALSAIALFVALFLIFNTMSLSVVRRRRELGTLRGLGVTRGGIFRLILIEALLYGIAGSAAGLAAGWAMAHLALRAVARTVSVLYVQVHAEHVAADPAVMAGGFLLGCTASLLASLVPAWDAARTPPAAVMRQGDFVPASDSTIRRLAAAGAVLLALAALLALGTVRSGHPEGGFVAGLLLLLGFSLMTPLCTRIASRLVQPVVQAAGPVWLLGSRYLAEAVARTAVVAAAILVAVAMVVALSTMVAGFRRTVDRWVGQTLRGDLYIEPAGRDASSISTAIPPRLEERIRRLPELAGLDTFRGREISYDGRLAYMVGVELAVQAQHGSLQMVSGEGRSAMLQALQQEGALISESFAYRFRLKPGDRMRIETTGGPRSLAVIAIYYDYSTDAGTVLVDRRLYEKLFQDFRTERLALYLRDGVSGEAVRRRVVELAGPELLLLVTANSQLRRRVIQIFDQTFAITYALQAMAGVVALLGVISTLTALVEQRSRELAVMRAAGARRRQVTGMVMVESLLIGLLGSLMGLLCGLLLALLLAHIINRQFFGWTIHLYPAPWIWIESCAIVTLTAAAAGWMPARLAGRATPAPAMRMEQ